MSFLTRMLAPGLKRNADGSADIFFDPEAPSGQESNWVPTDANGRFEVFARFYGPKKPLFDSGSYQISRR